MFQIIGAMAEFERELIRERVTAGMRHAKTRGIHVGRPSVQLDAAKIRELRESGLGFREIAAELKVSVGTLYNRLRS
jgi:DNA invertase Pin-like site-specific DNA recombinase